MKRLDGKGKVLFVIFAVALLISAALFNLEQMIPAILCFGVALIPAALLVHHQKNADQ